MRPLMRPNSACSGCEGLRVAVSSSTITNWTSIRSIVTLSISAIIVSSCAGEKETTYLMVNPTTQKSVLCTTGKYHWNIVDEPGGYYLNLADYCMRLCNLHGYLRNGTSPGGININ